MQPASPSVCPACNRPGSGGESCPHCGLIYARYRPRPGPQQERIRISLGARERLFRSLGGALAAGLSPLAWIETGGGLPPRLIQAMRADFRAGLPLSETLRRLGILDGAPLAFLQAGEIQGNLPETLRILADHAAEQRRDRRRLLLALLYPSALALGGAAILPLPILFREGFSAWLAIVGPLLLGAALLALLFLLVLPRLPPEAVPRRLFRRIGLALPLTSHALRHGSLATFLELLGACIASGLPIRQALPLAQQAVPHPAFHVDAPLRRIDAGATLAEALAEIAVVPPETAAQVAQGELAGRLDRVLPTLAAWHRQRSRAATVAAVVAVGILAAGAVMGALAWSVIEGWTSYLRMLEQVGG